MFCLNHLFCGIVPSIRKAARRRAVTAAGMCAGAGQSRTHLRAQCSHNRLHLHNQFFAGTCCCGASYSPLQSCPIIGPCYKKDQ